MKSNNTSDGKQGQIPTAVLRRFEDRTGSYLAATSLRTMWRLLAGETYVASRAQRKALSDHPWHSFEELHAQAELYNSCLAGEAKKPPLRNRNSGSVLDRQLSNVVCCLPAAEALRFPRRVDPRISGPIDHVDLYGRVTCDRTLRPIHQALLGLICGLYKDRRIYVDRGLVTPEGKIMLSANKAIRLLVSHLKSGGASSRYMEAAFRDLVYAEVTSEVAEHLPGSRRHFMCSDWLTAQRAVDDANGIPEWVDLDDPRPTTQKLQNTYKFELSEQLKYQLDHEERNLVFFNANIWRSLEPFTAGLFVWLQASRAKRISHKGRVFQGITFFAGGPLLNQLGLTQPRRYSSVRDTIWASMLQIQRVVDRFEWVSEPWRPFKTSPYFHFCARLKPGKKAEIRDSWQALHGVLRKPWLTDERNLAYLAAWYAEHVDAAGEPPPLRI